jgi:sugar-specific transcriptional regulator TrmB
LINFIWQGKRKIYQSTDPENFLTFIENKKTEFQKLLPELQTIQNNSPVKETASIFKGIKGIKEVYNIMINTDGKEYNTFGGGPITAEIMTFDWWLNLHERRIANKLPSRQIFDKLAKEIDNNQISSKPLTEIRYLEKEFAQFQETVIVGGQRSYRSLQ